MKHYKFIYLKPNVNNYEKTTSTFSDFSFYS